MREQFLNDAEVAACCAWLSRNLARIPVRLRVPASPFVPDAVAADTTFGALLPTCYRWRMGGMSSGDWGETLERMAVLSSVLRKAVDDDDAAATLAACDAVADWGADRNRRVGASAYVRSLGNELPAYLRRAREALRLAAPDPTGRFRAVPRMNATLAKIHALCATDGLPMYDARVASAITVLIEMWRRETGRDAEPLAPMLRFPAVGADRERRLRSVFPDAADPGLLSHNLSSEIATAGRWLSATVRLALLMEAVLAIADDELFVAYPSEPFAYHHRARMAAFSGALFVAGYDPKCLLPAAVPALRSAVTSPA